MKFGQQIKELRIEAQLTLRDFCRRIGMDPSNWSKIERGIIQPPQDPQLLGQIQSALGLDAQQLQNLQDLADVARGEIPVDLRDDELMAKMPAFFRAMKGQEYTEADLEKLKESVKKLHSQ
jgi:transcriptional regulator with XRE-family HTH domain